MSPAQKKPAPKNSTSKTPARKTPTRKASLKARLRRRLRNFTASTRVRLILAALLLVALAVGVVTVALSLAPKGNTDRSHFDAIIVLGYPADDDGNPTPEQLERVTEAVHEYERGVAGHIIMSGSAAHNHFVEAEVMARTAHAMGVPLTSIVEEPQALDTIQNACYSARIMHRNGWSSAEAISSAYHLPRAGLIFSTLPIEWRSHAAPPMTSAAFNQAAESLERIKTLRYLLWSRWSEGCVAE